MSKRRKSEPGPEPTLPVTPMLDMAFQLLAFFIFTYHPSDLEGQMQLALPSADVKAAAKPESVDPTAKPDPSATLEVEPEITVAVKTQNDGVNNGIISGITVEDRSGPAAIRPVNTEQKITDALTDHLLKLKDAVDTKAPVKLKGDSKLKWESVVQVMDACRKAGFENISFVQPPDFGLSAN